MPQTCPIDATTLTAAGTLRVLLQRLQQILQQIQRLTQRHTAGRDPGDAIVGLLVMGSVAAFGAND